MDILHTTGEGKKKPQGTAVEKIEAALERFWDPANWLGAIFYAVVFLIAAIIVSRFIRLATGRLLTRSNAYVDPTVVIFLTQLAQIAIYIVGLIVYFHIVPALQKLGTALLTGVSVMSVVFGLAAQNTLSNLVAGCTLLLYRPFHIDDFIQVATPTGTEAGIVERLTLGYTMVRTLDDRLVIIPNSLMASQVSLNLNRRALSAMTMVSVGVSDGEHVSEVRSALIEAADANKRIHKIAGCQTQNSDDGITILSLRAWTPSVADAKEARKEIADVVAQRFAGQNAVFVAQAE